jgi:hypothetical protein
MMIFTPALFRKVEDQVKNMIFFWVNLLKLDLRRYICERLAPSGL